MSNMSHVISYGIFTNYDFHENHVRQSSFHHRFILAIPIIIGLFLLPTYFEKML